MVKKRMNERPVNHVLHEFHKEIYGNGAAGLKGRVEKMEVVAEANKFQTLKLKQGQEDIVLRLGEEELARLKLEKEMAITRTKVLIYVTIITGAATLITSAIVAIVGMGVTALVQFYINKL